MDVRSLKFPKMPKLPELPLPDLVGFNNRIHARIDPYFEGRWVRRAAWIGLGGFLFSALVWVYFAAGLPSSEKLLAYQPPLPTNVRGYNGNPVQTFARERRVELAYDEYPPIVAALAKAIETELSLQVAR